jgi:hypothetical protein
MSKSNKLRKRSKRDLPFQASLFPFDLPGCYINVTKIKGELYKAGHRSVWISPHNQLIFNLPRSKGYQGTLIYKFNGPITETPQAFLYFGKWYTITRWKGRVEISSQYQADLGTNFVTL